MLGGGEDKEKQGAETPPPFMGVLKITSSISAADLPSSLSLGPDVWPSSSSWGVCVWGGERFFCLDWNAELLSISIRGDPFV